MKKKIRLLIACFILFYPFLKESKAAEKDSFPFDLSLEELQNIKIKVASFFEENDLVVASTVELITDAEWRRHGARRTQDAIMHLPGTMVLPSYCGTEAISIRGYTNEFSVRGIATLIDGVPVNTLSGGTAQYWMSNFDLGTLDRIEMIRGPGSVLYGSDAFHGVYSLKTFEAEENRYSVSLEGGNLLYNQEKITGSYGLGHGFRLDAAVAHSGQPDQENPYSFTHPDTGRPETGERGNTYDSFTAVVRLKSDPEAALSFRLSGYTNLWNGNRFSGSGRFLSKNLPAPYTDQSTLLEKDWGHTDTDFYMGKGTVTYKLPYQIEAELMGFYWQNKNAVAFDLSRVISLYPSMPFSYLLQRQDDKRYGVNVILRQPTNTWNFQWVAGYGYNNLSVPYTLDERYDINHSIVYSAPLAFEGKGRDIYSFFLHTKISVDIADYGLHIVNGVRIDRYSDFGTHLTPRAGLIFQPTARSAFKALYGQAFRAPTGAETFGTGTARGNIDLEPEEIDTFEFIFMHQTDKWKGDVAYYISKWREGIQDEYSPDPIDTRDKQYKNTGVSKSHGVEASLSYIDKTYRIDLSGSYVESKNVTDDRRYTAFPKYILNLGFGYNWEAQGITLYLCNRIHLEAREGPIYDTIPRPDSLSDYYRTDLNIEKVFSDHFSAWLNVRNLFFIDNFLPSIWNSEGGIPDEEANVSIGIKAEF